SDYALLPSDYNGIMTTGGVWLADATIDWTFAVTSQIYPIEVIEEMGAKPPVLLDLEFRTIRKEERFLEELQGTPELLSLEMRQPLKRYWIEPESLQGAPQLLEISMRSPLVTTDFIPEELVGTPELLEISMRAALVKYSNWPAEELQAVPELLGVTLT
ncbi:hypothetical protein, partial [Idiomarina abyssalis]|uniref:hypothetical protein n=1 Tax=Idiomarina abyssalis TaxID=86102 RepID=UPI003A8FC8B0